MARSTRLTVELLESRALLSGLSLNLTTDKTVYQVGQPIQMTFTETNVSNRPVTVDVGPSIDGFTVRQNGVTVWQSNAGINPLYLEADTLQPGQSLTLHATWDGIPIGDSSVSAKGTFVVFNQLDPSGAIATFQVVAHSSQPSPPSATDPPTNPVQNPTPPAPPATPVPAPIPSPVAVTMATDHPVFRRGHPVRMTLTLTNISNEAVNLFTDPTIDGFTVLKGSTVAWRSTRSVPAFGVQTLGPGQSIVLTAVWKGKPNQPGIKRLSPGTYTVQAAEGGYTASATIAIGVSHTPTLSRAAGLALVPKHRHGK